MQGSWKKKIVDPDLQAERDQCDFDKQEALSKLVDQVQLQQVASHQWLLEHPDTKNTHRFYEMTRSEQMKHWYVKFRRVCELDKERKFVSDN